ncbi:MAG: Crp/Fnr family transcriptional regulator [Gammaproteobacteria bacterium]|nr:Crp/Fnr family transcriptional regulator [Pseudomonadales bacterium]
MTLPSGHHLYEPGDAFSFVYFPVDCVISMMYILTSGVTGQLAQVGREGIVDTSISMGTRLMTNLAVVHHPGATYYLPVQVFRKECARHSELLSHVLCCTQLLLKKVTLTALCNRQHSLSQQLCRWLLDVSDRTNHSEHFLTQQQIASLLGVCREGVTEATERLQKLGVITCERGSMTILDRPELERLACGCYVKLKMESERLILPDET